jgi:hypothetical protein
VAIANSSISTPPTHRTAGSLLLISKWLASSSKPLQEKVLQFSSFLHADGLHMHAVGQQALE